MKTNSQTVLIIEPHPLMRASLRAVIETEKDLSVVETTPASDNAFSLMVSSRHDLLFLSQKPDIILFALGNPDHDDLQALDRLKKIWTDTLILALTSGEVPGQERAALKHGANAALAKTASRHELLQALRAMKSSNSI